MVSGCSDGMPKDNTDSVAVSDDVVSDLMMVESESDAGLETVNDAVETSDTSVGTEQTETSETEEQSGDMEGGGFAATFYCLIGNFVEIVLVSKNAPRGSHCGGACRKRHSLFKKDYARDRHPNCRRKRYL